MPIKLEYIEDGVGVLMIGTGVVSGEDIRLANEEIYSEERIDRQEYQLVDWTGVDKFDVTRHDMETLAEQDRVAALRNPGILISSAGDRDVIFGLVRMWEEFVHGTTLKTHVSRTLPEARAWIAKIREKRVSQE